VHDTIYTKSMTTPKRYNPSCGNLTIANRNNLYVFASVVPHTVSAAVALAHGFDPSFSSHMALPI
jgi:hypothetical protein